jgi:hypothetical protein
MATLREIIGERNEVATGIALLPPDRLDSYARGIIARNEKITPQEYAALMAAKEAIKYPPAGFPMVFGVAKLPKGTNPLDIQRDDHVQTAYTRALQQANEGKVKEYNFGEGESVDISAPPKERSILGRMLGKNW